jgi:hypothetical protein
MEGVTNLAVIGFVVTLAITFITSLLVDSIITTSAAIGFGDY